MNSDERMKYEKWRETMPKDDDEALKMAFLHLLNVTGKYNKCAKTIDAIRKELHNLRQLVNEARQ